MDAYRPKQRITLSFAKRNGRKCIAAAYGGDDTLRQNLSREPGAIMTGDTAYLPAENFVLAEFLRPLCENGIYRLFRHQGNRTP